jgi:hypothetical protein
VCACVYGNGFLTVFEGRKNISLPGMKRIVLKSLVLIAHRYF